MSELKMLPFKFSIKYYPEAVTPEQKAAQAAYLQAQNEQNIREIDEILKSEERQ